MVERSRSFKIQGADTTDQRIALYERKEVIERLQEELNAEREASSTSASEALSMILKLQGEKAELAMEADQYKRMVQEQMSHAEISFALLQDLIYQKEIETDALVYQVEAYRSQLLSLGVTVQENLEEDDHMSLCDRSQTPSSESVIDLSVPEEKGVIEQSLDSQKSSLDVYWDQIKKLDEKVKELTEFRDSMQYKKKISFSEYGLMKGGEEEDVASSSNFQEDTKIDDEAKGLCKALSKQRKAEKKKLCKQTRDRSGKRNRVEYEAELLRLRQRVEQLERERTNTEAKTGEVLKQEEISLVNEIKEEISYVQPSEVKRLDSMENLQHWIDPAIISVQEAMLYFWL